MAFGQKKLTEVIPVPADYLPPLWPTVARFLKRHGGEVLDVERIHGRLLLGRDLLWIGLQHDNRWTPYTAAILTTVSDHAPTHQKAFVRDARSLTVHLAAGARPGCWIDSAVERIVRYGKDNGCRQIFVAARKCWRRYAVQFFGAFEATGYTYDRPSKTAGGKFHRQRARPGHYRRVEIAPEGIRRQELYRPAKVTYVRSYADWIPKTRACAGDLPQAPLVG